MSWQKEQLNPSIATSSTLGTVKIGNGLNITSDGTLSAVSNTSSGSNSSTQIDSVNLNIRGFLPVEGSTTTTNPNLTIRPLLGTKIIISFTNGSNKVFPFEASIGIPEGYSLYMNISSGDLNVLTSTNINSNQIELLRVSNYKITGGVLFDYVNPVNNINYPRISPKNYDVISWTGSTSGVTFVNNKTSGVKEFWVFEQMNYDDHSGTANIQRRDPNNGYSLISTMSHNIGHCNTVDYNQTIDSLIIGNGSKKYDLPLAFWVFPNVQNWIGQTAIDWNTIPKIVYDLSDIVESKCQAVWGDSNGGNNDIVYVITNDNKVFRRLLLGKGINQLEKGTFIPSVADNDFNGTYKILETWWQEDGGGVNQDSIYYNGCIYSSTNGNTSNETLGPLAYKFQLCQGGIVNRTAFHIPLYNSDGSIIESLGEGFTIDDGKIYMVTSQAPLTKIIIFDVV